MQGQNFPTITSWQEIITTYFLILRFLTDLDATKDDFGGCNTYITAKCHMLKKPFNLIESGKTVQNY